LNEKFQKCVKAVSTERGWGRSRLLPIVFIDLQWREKRNGFHYAPRYSEIREWLNVMVRVMGKEEVEKELLIKLGDNYEAS